MRTIYTILLLLLCAILPAEAQQDYQQLWADVYRQAKADKPKNEMNILERISDKALKENHYGQLLTADLLRLSLVRQTYGDDSLTSVRQQLEQKMREAKKEHPALATVYACALGLKNEALADPALLAHSQAGDLSPLLIPGSEVFGGDLLSAIAWQTGQYKKAHDYYEQTGNRRAALITDLWMAPSDSKSRIVQWCDSLLAKYGDLKESQLVTALKARQLSDSASVAISASILRKWAGDTSEYGNPLRNIELEAKEPSLSIRLEGKYIHSKERPWLHVGSTNLSKVDVAVYGTKKDRRSGAPLWHATRQLSLGKAWRPATDSLRLPFLPYGTYEVVAKAQGVKPVILGYIVSDLNVTVSPMSEKNVRMRVVDTHTGRPVPGAKIEIGDEGSDQYEEVESDTAAIDVDTAEADTAVYDLDETEVDSISSEPSVHGIFTTDSQGEAVVPYCDGGMYVRPFTADDHWRASEMVYPNESEPANPCQILLNAYSDRALYRPGDTAHVAVVAFVRRPGHRRKALSHMPLQLLFSNTRDYDHPIDTVNVTTDDYGTAYADIPLTKKWVTGNEYNGRGELRWKADGALPLLERLIGHSLIKDIDNIDVDVNGLSFRVEEYKSGSLQVSLHTSPSHYMPGDTVTVSGHVSLLSGASVAGAKVEAKGNSTLYTDSNGMFTDRIAIPKDTDNHFLFHLEKAYTFTAPDGQQRTDYVRLSYSNQRAFLTSDICDIYHSDKGYRRDSLLTVRCLLTDAQNNKVQDNVKWLLDNGTKGEIAANRQDFIPIHSLEAGLHTLKIWAEGDTLSSTISVIDPAAHHLSKPTFFWAAASADAFKSDGQPVTLQMGTTEKGLTLYYELRSADSLLDRGSMALSDTLLTHTLYYKETYGGGVTLSVAAYGQGRMKSYDIMLPYEEPTETLHAQWDQLDNVTEPGQRQEWRLRVSHTTGQPADAQAMVTLYDSALDLINDNTWNSSWELRDDLPTSYTQTLDNDELIKGETGRPKQLAVPDIRPAIFADGLIRLQANARSVAYRLGGWTLESKGKGKPGYCHGIVYDPSGEVLMGAMLKTSQGASAVTDVDGTFSIPVHGTAQLTASYVGLQSATVTVTSGEPVVITLGDDVDNLEEVVALGYAEPVDKLSAPVIKRDVEVKEEDRLYAATNKTKNLAPHNQGKLTDENSRTRVRRNFRTLALWAPATTTDHDGYASFAFTMPDNVTTWRLQGIVHDREGAVASIDTTVQTRMALMVTDNLPRFLRRGDDAQLPLTVSNIGDERFKGTLTVQATHLGQSLLDEKYKFGLKPSTSKTFTATLHVPADSMLQSITVRAEASAKSHGDGMEKTIPIVSDKERVPVITMVSRSAADAIREALGEMDTVRGNDALSLAAKVYAGYKLNELNDAENKSESFQDVNTPFAAFRRLQCADGSFSWWPGMPASRIVTVTVAEMLAPLTKDYNEIARLLQPTTTKLMTWLADDAKQLEEAGAASCNLEEAYHILYALSLLPTRQAAKANTARKALLDYAETHGADLTILGKARVATALHIDGRTKAALSMMESLSQYAVTTSDRGTYFDTPKAHYSWRDYKIPTVTAAIHALSLIAPSDTALLLGMKRWLVEEKKTQKWDTPIVTVDAVAAFLTGPMPQRVAWPVVTGWHEATVSDLPDERKDFRVSREIIPVDSTRRTSNIGDRVKAIIKVHADRDYDFVRITDHRPACLMPVNQLSGYHWLEGCYVRQMDEQTDYYFETLPKGDYTLTTEYFLDRSGQYHAGIIKAECEYNPAFMACGSQPVSVTVNGKNISSH
jgi:hypothetical protein